MRWAMTDWQMVESVSKAKTYEVTAHYVVEPHVCPHCRSAAIVRFGVREQKYKDRPLDDRPVIVCVQRYRYQCSTCGKVFHQPIPDLDDKHRMTKRLIDYIHDALTTMRQHQVATAVGVSRATISRLLQQAYHEGDLLPPD